MNILRIDKIKNKNIRSKAKGILIKKKTLNYMCKML